MLAERLRIIFKYLIIIAFALLVYYFIPKKSSFKYQFIKNQVWKYDDLYAPFSFPVIKTDEEIKSEKEIIISSFKPIFRLDKQVLESLLSEIQNNNDDYLLPHYHSINAENAFQYISNLLTQIYSVGIYNPKDIESQFTGNIIRIIDEDKRSKDLMLEEIYSVEQAKNHILTVCIKDSIYSKEIQIQKIVDAIKPNLQYDKQMTFHQLQAELDDILATKGMVLESEKIISRGVRITDENYQVLQSLKMTFEGKEQKGVSAYLNQSGYLFLILLIFTLFFTYLSQIDKQIFNTNKEIFLIISTISLFIIISSLVVKQSVISIYLIPFCIVPILFISFFGARIAFLSHIVVILSVSIFVTESFDFIFIQLLSGFAVVIVIQRIRYISQFFWSIMIIMLVYVLSYVSLQLLKISEFNDFEYWNLLWFAGNFILTLLSYPLIYAYEKLFGKVSDISLIELSDLNKKLLRELTSKAPGTFQHSIQLATLTEAILNKIGGNALLAKVGCLYHDIGKINAPAYFIENQKDVNPYEKIESEKEAAAIIIRHVTDGVKIAKEHKIPKEIINFIKTHHGTTRVEYFYRNYQKKFPDDQSCEHEFRYPGPKPTTKEMAVVMIVDSVEAATRGQKDNSSEAIDKLVDQLVEYKMRDNQFQNANITLKEIKIAKDIIKNGLRSVYHHRIEYPAEN